jgi:biopolymer transport protein TolR
MPKIETLEAAGHSRLGRSRRVMSSLAEINVVPLIDVMLVLLIIFMVTAPMLQRGLDVNLPEARRAPQIASERIFVTVPAAFRNNRIVMIGEEPIRVDLLEERIRQAMSTRTEKEVFLRGDGGVQLRDLTDVFDRLKAGGVTKVGIVTKLPGER